MKNQLFILLLLLYSYYLFTKKQTDLLILVGIFTIYILFFSKINQEKEYMGNLTNEAVQNIASLYNSGTLRATNLELTGNLKVTGQSDLNGNLKVTGQSDLNGNLKVTGKSDLTGDVNIGSDIKKNNIKLSLSNDGNLTVSKDNSVVIDYNADRNKTIMTDSRYFITTKSGILTFEGIGSCGATARAHCDGNAHKGNHWEFGFKKA